MSSSAVESWLKTDDGSTLRARPKRLTHHRYWGPVGERDPLAVTGRETNSFYSLFSAISRKITRKARACPKMM